MLYAAGSGSGNRCAHAPSAWPTKAATTSQVQSISIHSKSLSFLSTVYITLSCHISLRVPSYPPLFIFDPPLRGIGTTHGSSSFRESTSALSDTTTTKAAMEAVSDIPIRTDVPNWMVMVIGATRPSSRSELPSCLS